MRGHAAAMPELPEVETVRCGLLALVRGRTIAGARIFAPRLRSPLPDLASLIGRRVLDIARRGKFLLWDCAGLILVSHLGMSGSWRVGASGRRHDHVELLFAEGLHLTYHDPRRFGSLMLCRKPDELPALAALGPEPFAAEAWDALRGAAQRRRCAIKALLMDQRVLAGIGNIYASEACFRAGIRPLQPARRLAERRLARLLEATRAVLAEAIAAGGSTIADYRAVNGLSGRFQHAFAVYDRAGQPCRVCGAAIRGRIVAGRSTYWCPRCQR